MSDNSLVSFATLDGGDDGEEVQTCGAGAYTGADDDAQGTCWLEDSARAVARNPVEKAARPTVSKKPSGDPLSLGNANLLLAYVDGLADPRPAVITRLLAETGMRVAMVILDKFYMDVCHF